MVSFEDYLLQFVPEFQSSEQSEVINYIESLTKIVRSEKFFENNRFVVQFSPKLFSMDDYYINNVKFFPKLMLCNYFIEDSVLKLVSSPYNLVLFPSSYHKNILPKGIDFYHFSSVLYLLSESNGSSIEEDCLKSEQLDYSFTDIGLERIVLNFIELNRSFNNRTNKGGFLSFLRFWK